MTRKAAVVGQLKDAGPPRRVRLVGPRGTGAARPVGRDPDRRMADHRAAYKAPSDAGPAVPFRLRLRRAAEDTGPDGVALLGVADVGPSTAGLPALEGLQALRVRPENPLGGAGAGRPAVGIAASTLVGAPCEGGAPFLAARQGVSPRVAVRAGELGPEAGSVAGEAGAGTGAAVPPVFGEVAPAHVRVARRSAGARGARRD